jgi:patatin-related protein
MASQGHAGSLRSEVFETRIALSFFGGVSLAVYESGMAVEFFRLVTGDGIYKKLHDQIGPVKVDIISGTSAGGLSAAFLATALINGSPNLDPLLRLWLKKASFETLLTSAGAKTASSLFNGDHFLELIEEALNQIAGDSPDREPYQQYLDLFMTATSLEGDVSSFTLNNQKIEARSHQRVFRFRYRGPDIRQRNIGEPEHNDFDAQHRSLLAVAARASASFPMVFKPVSIGVEQFKHLSPELGRDSLHIDGGVLDNKPIRLALEAVFQRRADKQIDRRLFYVEPIPENINDTRDSIEAARTGEVNSRWTPLRVLYAAVKDLPSYQSITSALDELRVRNDELAELRQTLSHYNALAAKIQSDVASLGAASLIAETSSPTGPSRTYIPASDKASRLFRAQEDGYLDLRLSRNPSPLFQACKAMSDELIQHPVARDPEVLAALFRLKNQLLWTFDFEYHRRHYQYLHQVIRQLFTQLDEGELVEIEQDRRALFQSLNRLRTHYNDQETQVVLRQERFRDAREHLEEEIKNMLPEFSPELLESGTEQVRELLESTDRRIAQLPGAEEQCKFFYRLRGELQLELERERDRLDLEAMVARNNPGFRSPLEDGYNLLKTAVDQFHERDMIIYPVMRKDDMGASELQTVLAARFGPLEGVNYLSLSDQSHKVAGETAFHFGGFMNETWRGNDLVWGRLDAIETLFRQLLPDGEKNPLFQELFEEQKRIVVEMREKFGVGIVHPLSEQPEDGTPPPEDLLIGKQNIHDIPDRTKIVWLKQTIGTAVQMIFFPQVPLPVWCQRCFSGLFVRVLVSPRRVLLLAAAVCSAIILGLSAIAAHFIAKWLPTPGSLPAQAGEVAALFGILLLGLTCLALARFAHSIRSKFLRGGPSAKKFR